MNPDTSQPIIVESEFAAKARQFREDANKGTGLADVDYSDLEHFVGNCRRRKDKESFDTAIRILEAIKKQVLERK